MLPSRHSRIGKDTHYAKRLLQERKEELRALEARHKCELVDLDDYSSCRRSLLHAINELEKMVATGPQEGSNPIPGASTAQSSGFVTKSNS